MVLQHTLGHKPHTSPSYWHISINRSGCSDSLNASARLWWIRLVNRTITERQFHQRNTLRLFGFSYQENPKWMSCRWCRERKQQRLPPENWIVHFQLNVTWKIHGGQCQFVSDQHVPGDRAIFIRFWYIRNILFVSSCLILQIGAEVFFPPVVQG